MATPGSANSLFVVLVVAAIAIVVARVLYIRHGAAAGFWNSISGGIGAIAWFLTALWLMIGFGIPGLIIGGAMMAIAVFIGSWHADVLTDADLRARIVR